ncbi:uncharacterized protein IL334_001616 [Kwoniella shivajii]|uniref:Zinc finger protein n=1 Tax=Kwoniella shivajii TaxID=564305 RepID=A0ABZ1CTK3_9TREE|nr:hypothetical protein IL334_001616 [Kwoniella shivajii]
MPSSSIPFPGNGISHSPPVLPVPRQPSPLSFSSISGDGPPSPPTPASSFLGAGESISSTTSSYRAPLLSSSLVTPTFSNEPIMTSPASGPSLSSPSNLTSPSHASSSKPTTLVPVRPSSDSLLLRSTFSALEHSTSTLKRLSKSVLTSAWVVAALAEQLERAEEDLFSALGDLGRWLENGYGLQAKGSVWDPEGGIKKVNKEKRRREREEREVWVEHGLKAVKAELKRQGLAGGGAQSRFDQTAKQFYHQTSVYLSPQTASTPSVAGPSTQPHFSSSNYAASSTSTYEQIPTAPSDMAQAIRHAQWDLARYNHHSTLLYAVPPSSIGCLDLLVGLYGWVGGLLGESQGRKETDDRDTSNAPALRQRAKTTPPSEKLPSIDHSVRLITHSSTSSSSKEHLKSTLSVSLTQLANIRSELLQVWAERNYQTQLLEDEIIQRQGELGVSSPEEITSSRFSEIHGGHNAMTPVSSAGIEHKKGKKMHKVHRSVGGRLRDFLNPSMSSNNLAAMQAGVGTGSGSNERVSRMSLDGGYGRGELSAPAPIRRKTTEESITTPTQPSTEKLPTNPQTSTPKLPLSFETPPLPPTVPPKENSPRPRLPSRHSVQMPTGVDYVSPFIASNQYPVPIIPFDASPDLRSSGLREQLPRHSIDGGRPSVGGVGGLGAGGDEDERREEAGRKKEGVLWGLGSWEGLNKGGGGKGKWEKFWVVLDHSRIYEYRDNKSGALEGAHAMIDLKFASVREVFEIVTPSQGKRLYQATSESEMKLWLYAICNAIESCINGTSSVRTFDASKLRTVSGSLDDHALPARGKLGLGFNSRAIGLGFPIPPNGRRSMPPTPTEQTTPDHPFSLEKRTRKTSLKKVLKQSSEMLSNVVNGNGSNRNSLGGGGYGGALDLPRNVFGKAGSRTSLPLSSTPEIDINKYDNDMPPPPVPTSSRPKSKINTESLSHGKDTGIGIGDKAIAGTWVDGDIEKRVLEMAGLGLGLGMGSGDDHLPRNHPSDSPNSIKRRVKSEAIRKTPTHPSRAGYANLSEGGGEAINRSKSHDDRNLDFQPESDSTSTLDMKELRRIAGLESNSKCADCGKNMKSSRWATISLRDNPMVMFICIRCCGIHRSLGTHISKPRSVDLDSWTPEMISLAKDWGNSRCNELWEKSWEGGRVTDDQITDFIKAKYVQGRWLSDQDKIQFGLKVNQRDNGGNDNDIQEPVGTAI